MMSGTQYEWEPGGGPSLVHRTKWDTPGMKGKPDVQDTWSKRGVVWVGESGPKTRLLYQYYTNTAVERYRSGTAG